MQGFGFRYLAALIGIKVAEYAIVGVSNPVFPIFNTLFFLTSAMICLGLANFVCFLRQAKFQLAPILRVYLMTSLIMAPASFMRIAVAISDETPQKSWAGLWIKGVQIIVFLFIVDRISRDFPRTERRAERSS